MSAPIGTQGANALIAKIDELVQHRPRPEPKSLSQIVYERSHPFEDFEQTLQDAWDVGEPVRREKAGMGCCSGGGGGAVVAEKKPQAGGGCGCGPKAAPQKSGGGCGCGPKSAEAVGRKEGGGCGCSAPPPEGSAAVAKGKQSEDPTLVDKEVANRIYKNASWKDRFIIASVKAGFLNQKVLKAVAERTGGMDAVKEVCTEVLGEPEPKSAGCHSNAAAGGNKNVQFELPRAVSGANPRANRRIVEEEEEIEPMAIAWKTAPKDRTPEASFDKVQKELVAESYPPTNIPDITPVRTHSSHEEFNIKWKDGSEGAEVHLQVPKKKAAGGNTAAIATSPAPPPPPPLPPAPHSSAAQHPDDLDGGLSPICRTASGGGRYIRYSCRACRLPIMPIMPPAQRINPSLYRAATRTGGAGSRGKAAHRGKKRKSSIRRKASGSEVLAEDEALDEAPLNLEGRFCACSNPIPTPLPSRENLALPRVPELPKPDLVDDRPKPDLADGRPKSTSASIAVTTTESLITDLVVKEQPKAKTDAGREKEGKQAENEGGVGHQPGTQMPAFGYPSQGDSMMPTTIPAGFVPIFMTYTPGSQYPQFSFGLQPGAMAPPMLPFAAPQFFHLPAPFNQAASPCSEPRKEEKPHVEEVHEPRVDEFDTQPPSPQPPPEASGSVGTKSPPVSHGEGLVETGSGFKISGKSGALAAWLEKNKITDPFEQAPEDPLGNLDAKLNVSKDEKKQECSSPIGGHFGDLQASGWSRMQRFVQEKLPFIGTTKKLLWNSQQQAYQVKPIEKPPSVPSTPKRTTCSTPVRYADTLPPTHPRYQKELQRQQQRMPVPINFKPAPKAEHIQKPVTNFVPQQRVPAGPWETCLDPMPLALPRPPTVINTTGRLDAHARPRAVQDRPYPDFGYQQHLTSAQPQQDPYASQQPRTQQAYPGYNVETYAVTDVIRDDPERLLEIYMKKGEETLAAGKETASFVIHEAGDSVKVQSDKSDGYKLKDSEKNSPSHKVKEQATVKCSITKETGGRTPKSFLPKKSPHKSQKSVAKTAPQHKPPSSTCLCDQCDTKRQKLERFMLILKGPSIDIQELKTCCWSGVPHQIRPAIWKILSSFLPLNIQMWDEVLSRRRTKYWNYVRKHCDAVGEAYEEIRKQIRIDLPRMRLAHPMLENSRILEIYDRVLFVWALRHPNAGYVQGLNDLLTPFIMVFAHEYVPHEMIESKDPNVLPEIANFLQDMYVKNIEADAYWCFKNLLKNIQSNYTATQPGIQLSVILMEDLVRRVDPELHSHLAQSGVEYLQFAFRWMNNLLMRELPLSCFIRLWDTCLAEPEGFTTFYVYLYTALLRTFRAKILSSSDFQTLLIFLQNLPTSDWTEKDIVKLIANAYKLKYAESVAKHSGNPDKIDIEGESGTSLEKEKISQTVEVKRTKPLASKGVMRRG